jgi:hypothetical protein
MSKAEKFNLLDLKNLSMVNLADDRRLGHSYQVIIDFHLYHAIHRLDGDFL